MDQDHPDDDCTADLGPYGTSYRYHAFRRATVMEVFAPGGMCLL
jgi:hypothetical protein